MDTAQIRAYRQRMRRFRRMLAACLEEDCSALEVSVPQCDALLEIEARGETTIADLSDAIRLDKSTLSRTIDTLVELGHVARSPDPSDRRYNLLTLTPEGRAACERINATSDESARSVFNEIPPEEQLAALDGFVRVVDALAAIESRSCEPGGRCRDATAGEEPRPEDAS